MASRGGVSRRKRIQNVCVLSQYGGTVYVRGDNSAGESGVRDVVERQRGPRQGDGAETRSGSAAIGRDFLSRVKGDRVGARDDDLRIALVGSIAPWAKHRGSGLEDL